MTEPTDAKWGQPAHSGEPSYLDRLIDRLVMPPQSMTASDLRALHTEAAFMLRMQRSAQGAPPQPARAVLAKFGTPAFVGVEPVARLEIGKTQGGVSLTHIAEPAAFQLPEGMYALYTTPQPTQAQAGAVPLTDEQIHAIYDKVARREPYAGAVTRRSIVRAIEAAHGIKGGQHAE